MVRHTIGRAQEWRTMRASRRDVLTLVLAGGEGRRLYPLTRDRAKPAVPFGGPYRIVDFALSNAFHSGERNVYVLVQYKCQSLDRHIRSAWSLLVRDLGHWVECVPPQYRTNQEFYEGTADAVYQNVFLLEQDRPKRVLILSGDHVYRMDYSRLLLHHAACQADATLALLPVPIEEAPRFGIVEVKEYGRVAAFHEKPTNPPEWPGHPGQALANMGVYVFETEPLVRALVEDHREDTEHDFGMNILPGMVESHRVFGFHFVEPKTGEPGYWRDIGTLDAYIEAHRDLLSPNPPDVLDRHGWPLRTAAEQRPPCRILMNAEVSRSIISAGCVIEGHVERSVLGPGVRVEEGAHVEECILHGDVLVETGAQLKNVLADKRTFVSRDSVIGYDLDADGDHYLITPNGTVVLPQTI